MTLEGTGAEPERAWGSANMHNERRVNQVSVPGTLYYVILCYIMLSMLHGFITMVGCNHESAALLLALLLGTDTLTH